jgi:hypothetical protein
MGCRSRRPVLIAVIVNDAENNIYFFHSLLSHFYIKNVPIAQISGEICLVAARHLKIYVYFLCD